MIIVSLLSPHPIPLHRIPSHGQGGRGTRGCAGVNERETTWNRLLQSESAMENYFGYGPVQFPQVMGFEAQPCPSGFDVTAFKHFLGFG